MEHKLGVIVPYRNRKEHLDKFVDAIQKKLTKDKIDYELIIVEQADDKAFNRGKLLNIGVQKAIELECTYVALHDVDMIPIDVDYSPIDRPTHLATNFISDHNEKRVIFDGYFGGVTLFTTVDYIKVNGYSNEYWGWGYEDDDLLFRCSENFLDFNTKRIPSVTRNTAGLRFNGWDSYVKAPMPYSLDNYTMLISFEPDPISCRDAYDVDEYSIIAVPGYDTGMTYNTFNRYKFETFTTKKQNISLKSVIKPPLRTCLIATVDQYNKVIKLYQDGELIDETMFEGRLMPYHEQKEIIIGLTGNPQNKRRPFAGVVDYVAIWNHSLEPGQVEAIFKNLHLGVTENFEGYTNAHCLEAVYDMKASTNQKVFDLSGNERHGTVFHCDRVPVTHHEDYKEIAIPWRRESTFKLLPHEDNGFYQNKWTYTETRKNQIQFYNNVLKGKTNWRRDGLDSLKFKVMSDTESNKLHFISCLL